VTPAPGREPTRKAGPRDDAGFEAVARLDELPDRAPLGVMTATGEPVCLVRVDAVVHAMADRCPHQEFPMSAGALSDDGTFTCAWHGATFDLATGAVKSGPATAGLEVYEVRVKDGIVEVRTK
jgi:nitrite reductase/ring-hydroxylating ferredoxin subunit